jgi:hypothetical protein
LGNNIISGNNDVKYYLIGAYRGHNWDFSSGQYKPGFIPRVLFEGGLLYPWLISMAGSVRNAWLTCMQVDDPGNLSLFSPSRPIQTKTANQAVA